MAHSRTSTADTGRPPRRTLSRAIAAGGASGAAVGVGVAAILVFVLGAVEYTGPLGMRALLFLGFEAGFAGAIIGGVLAGLSGLRNTP